MKPAASREFHPGKIAIGVNSLTYLCPLQTRNCAIAVVANLLGRTDLSRWSRLRSKHLSLHCSIVPELTTRIPFKIINDQLRASKYPKLSQQQFRHDCLMLVLRSFLHTDRTAWCNRHWRAPSHRSVPVEPARADRGTGIAPRKDSQGRERRRSADAAADEIRVGGQSQDCKCIGPHRAAIDPRPRRRGDRIGGSGFFSRRYTALYRPEPGGQAARRGDVGALCPSARGERRAGIVT